MGAIYALEQIAKDSEDLHWPVMQILTAYLREHSAQAVKRLAELQAIMDSWEGNYYIPEAEGVDPEDAGDMRNVIESRARVDFLAIADVIRRRPWHWDPIAEVSEAGVHREPLNLERCDLRRADLRRAQLEGANFAEAHLEGARFRGAQMRDANFRRTQIKEASLGEAQLEGAYFEGAQLEGANFAEAHLQAAYFGEAQLEEANFAEAHLERARFRGAQMRDASFWRAQLHGADLRRVDLTETNGVTQGQLDSAICDETTKPPPGLVINLNVSAVEGETNRPDP